MYYLVGLEKSGQSILYPPHEHPLDSRLSNHSPKRTPSDKSSSKLTAPKLETHGRPRSAAFAVVLDRSGSMSGKPLQLARESCASVVRNLRPNDYFTLVVFDDSAQVVISPQKPLDRQAMEAALAGI